MNHYVFALLVTALGSAALLAFGAWIDLKPITSIALTAVFAIANMAAAIFFIRLEQRAQAQKGK